MTAPSSRFRSWALQATALLAVAMRVHASHASSPSAFEWVESVPVETRYGLPDTMRTAAVWLSMIDGARDHIDIAAFYLANPPGRALSPIVDALKARAASGIRVRLLVDASFMHESQAAVDALAGSPGIVIREMPVKDMTGGVLHVKFMEVDDHDVFVGSQNWDWRALEHIHELGARIDNERMGKTFRAEFDHLWHLSETPADARLAAALPAAPAFEPAGELAPIVIDGKGGPSTVFAAFSPAALQPHWLTGEAATLERLLRGARSRIRIQVMTLSALRDFGPKGYWPTLDSAIRDAAARGVRVQVIVADWALRGKDSAYLQTLAAFPGIEVRVSTVPPASTGPIPYARVEHAKYALVDEDSGFVGTGNWSWSYFESSVDASLFVHGPLATTLGRIFDADWAGPYVRPLTVP